MKKLELREQLWTRHRRIGNDLYVQETTWEACTERPLIRAGIGRMKRIGVGAPWGPQARGDPLWSTAEVTDHLGRCTAT